MKKTLFGIAALAGLMLASCANENLVDPNAGAPGTATFKVNIASDIQSRAVNGLNGLAAIENIKWQVFAQNGQGAPIKSGETPYSPGTDGSTEILVTGLEPNQQYQIAFWAQNPACNAYTTTNLNAVTVEYSGYNNNIEMDAFCGHLTFSSNGSGNSVTLKRPLAQINVGLPSPTENTYTTSSVTITGKVCNALNVLTGEASGSIDATFAASNVPSADLTVNGNTYEYISMTYVLVNGSASFDSFTATAGNQTFGPFDGLPVQTNYRTNILGQETPGDVSFNVYLDAQYAGDDNDLFNDETQEPEPEPQPNVNVTAVNAVIQGDNVNLTATYTTTGDAQVTGATFTLTPVSLGRAADGVKTVDATSWEDGDIYAQYALSNLEPNTRYNVTVTVNYNDQVTEPSAGETTGQDAPYFDVPASEPEPETTSIWLVGDGSVNGQSLGWNLPGTEVKGTNNVYTLTLVGCSQFKFSTIEATEWDENSSATKVGPYYNDGAYTVSSQLGDAVYGGSGQTVNIQLGWDNIDLPWEGDYTITIDLDKKTLTALTTTEKPANIGTLLPCIYGEWSPGSWGIKPGSVFTQTSDGNPQTYYLDNITIPANTKFKICGTKDNGEKDDWNTFNYTVNKPDWTHVTTAQMGAACEAFKGSDTNTQFNFNFTGSITLKIYSDGSATVTFQN